MRNLQILCQDDRIVITINISKEALESAPPSSTGRSRLVATTSGHIPVGVDNESLWLSLNLINRGK